MHLKNGGKGLGADVFSSGDWSEPPKNLSLALQALWWIRKGGYRTGTELEIAHEIVVLMEGIRDFDWIHALVHWVEVDMGSADFWYRQAGKRRAKPTVAEEWEHIATQLSSEQIDE